MRQQYGISCALCAQSAIVVFIRETLFPYFTLFPPISRCLYLSVEGGILGNLKNLLDNESMGRYIERYRNWVCDIGLGRPHECS